MLVHQRVAFPESSNRLRPFQTSSIHFFFPLGFPNGFHGDIPQDIPSICQATGSWWILVINSWLRRSQWRASCLQAWQGGHHGKPMEKWDERGWKNIWFKWRMMGNPELEHMMHMVMCWWYYDTITSWQMSTSCPTWDKTCRALFSASHGHDGCHGLATFKASKLPPTHRLHRCTAGTADMNFNPRGAGLALKYEEIWHSKPLTGLDSFTKPLTSAGVNAARDGILKHLRTWFCQSFTLLMIQRVLPPPFLWRTQQNSTPACVWCVLPHLAVGPAFKTHSWATNGNSHIVQAMPRKRDASAIFQDNFRFKCSAFCRAKSLGTEGSEGQQARHKSVQTKIKYWWFP